MYIYSHPAFLTVGNFIPYFRLVSNVIDLKCIKYKRMIITECFVTANIVRYFSHHSC